MNAVKLAFSVVNWVSSVPRRCAVAPTNFCVCNMLGHYHSMRITWMRPCAPVMASSVAPCVVAVRHPRRHRSSRYCALPQPMDPWSGSRNRETEYAIPLCREIHLDIRSRIVIWTICKKAAKWKKVILFKINLLFCNKVSLRKISNHAKSSCVARCWNLDNQSNV